MTTWIDQQILERLRLHGLTFARDALVVAVCYVLAEYLRFDHAIPSESLRPLILWAPFIALLYCAALWGFGVHRRLWQYAGVAELRVLVDASVIATLIVIILDFGVAALGLWSATAKAAERPIPFGSVVIGGAFSLVGLALVRLWPRLVRSRPQATDSWVRVLIVGAGQAGQLVAADLLGNPQWRQLPVGFVDDDPAKRRHSIHNTPVLGTVDHLPEIVQQESVDIIGIAIPSSSTKQLDRILALAQQTSARIQVLPTHGEMMISRIPMRLRDVKLEDLLDRPPAPTSDELDLVQGMMTDQVVMVTGAAGSIGSELCRQLARFVPAHLLALDNNETELFYLERDLAALATGTRVTTVLGDITDVGKMGHIFRTHRPDVVFHAAAYKHVPMLERFPEEGVFVNVQGSLNICRLAAETGSSRFVFISTDKAVHPVNILGLTKRIGELISRAHQGSGPIFCSVRFGNVVGSRGSALPEFIRQIDTGGPVLVTHPDVERYFMTIPEAVSLVIEAAALARGGELFMLDMGEPIKIVDIAKRIIRVRGLRVGSDIEIMYTGLRPGEKLTEELVFTDEKVLPTQNPSIFAVEDEVQPNLPVMEEGVSALLSLASNGDTTALRTALVDVSQGLVVSVGRRLGSVG